MSFLVAVVIKPLAYISLPFVVLRSVAATFPVARYYARITLYLSTLSMVAACSAALAAGMAAVGRQFDVNYIVARTFYAVAGRVLEMKVDVEGQENLDAAQPAVLMANHQSMLDLLVVGR